MSVKIDAAESLTNAIGGYMVSVAATFYLLPMWGYHPSVSGSFAISAMFFGLSFTRAFMLRMLFRRLQRAD